MKIPPILICNTTIEATIANPQINPVNLHAPLFTLTTRRRVLFSFFQLSEVRKFFRCTLCDIVLNNPGHFLIGFPSDACICGVYESYLAIVDPAFPWQAGFRTRILRAMGVRFWVFWHRVTAYDWFRGKWNPPGRFQTTFGDDNCRSSFNQRLEAVQWFRKKVTRCGTTSSFEFNDIKDNIVSAYHGLLYQGGFAKIYMKAVQMKVKVWNCFWKSSEDGTTNASMIELTVNNLVILWLNYELQAKVIWLKMEKNVLAYHDFAISTHDGGFLKCYTKAVKWKWKLEVFYKKSLGWFLYLRNQVVYNKTI